NTATCPFAFIDEGNGLLLYLKEKVQPLAQKTGPGKDVDIWSYFDPVFQTAQLASTNLRRKLAFSINLRTDQINRLEQDDELIVYGNHDASTRFFILYKYKRDVLQKEENYGNGISTFYSTKEFNWNSALEPDVFLISSEDGSRKILRKQVRPFADDLPPFYLSPNGKYVVQFCGTDRHYYSYEILSGIWRKLTNDINVPLELGGNVANHVIADYYKPAGIVRWERDSLCLLIKDYYSDIWRVSLTAQKPSVCITGGFAKRNNVDLSVNGLENFSNSLIDSTVFLKVSWNNKNTQNRHKNPGFYSLNLYTRLLKPLIKEKGTIFYSIQSRHANKMVLKKQHSDKPESYVFAENFKELRDLKSSLPDQQVGPAVNKEFMSWKTFDGLECYGMLYKPKDFDPSKKYPVIVTYYELLSFDQRKLFELEGDERYKYHSYFLENGYLVFESEIYQEKMGQTCYNAYNCVVPGVKMLLKRIYIDPKRIGINGHSFGGYETNCLITQTNLFAAAVARSGISNMISMALGDIPGSKSIRTSSTLAETGQNRMGTTIWKNLDVYIANSPVLHADKVNTPLLLLHSKDDYNVPYLQSVEMFKALRRLGKKVWLISGDSGGHGGPKFWGQYMIQFFDYYLKGLAPRKWMTEGVPASQKGIADPFEVDIENSSPPQPTIYDKEAVIPIQVKDKVRKQ
ncbi:MAG: alpha/beta hydrolase family protein, partial [Sediminibacterium sp.]